MTNQEDLLDAGTYRQILIGKTNMPCNMSPRQRCGQQKATWILCHQGIDIASQITPVVYQISFTVQLTEVIIGKQK